MCKKTNVLIMLKFGIAVEAIYQWDMAGQVYSNPYFECLHSIADILCNIYSKMNVRLSYLENGHI